MKRGPILWLGLVAILLAIILGAVQNGHVQGLRNVGEVFPANFRIGFPLQGATYWSNTTITTTVNGTVVTVRTVPVGSSGLPSPGLGVVLASWYIYVLFAATLLLAIVVLLRGSRNAEVHYLPVNVQQQEEAGPTPSPAWSSQLRNQAVLRYYSKMSRACTEAGIEESQHETPTEFIDRVAAKLRLDSVSSATFARIFNRARYGLELSSQEVKDASEFMGQFVDALQRRIGND
jgi:hypothetical protein